MAGIDSLSQVGAQIQQSLGLEQQQQQTDSGFFQAFQSAMANVNNQQHAADAAVTRLQTGQSESLHEVTIAMEKADISLRLATQMRNKALDAYNEIMRMQV